MIRVSIDFETRSLTDLKYSGVQRYVEDPYTDPWCMAWAVGDGPVHLWELGEPFPDDLYALVLEGCELHAWNAAFEYWVWNGPFQRHGAPPVPLERFHCTMVRAAAVALPRKLERAAKVLLPDVEKDMAGNRLSLQMAKPRSLRPDGTPVWWDVEEKRRRLGAYCRQDVVVERMLGAKLPALPESERRLWLLDQHSNNRGVRVDLELVAGAQYLVDVVVGEANERIRELSDEVIPAVTDHNAIRHWINGRGVDTDTISKDWLEETLTSSAELAPDVREVLTLRQLNGLTSVAKLPRFPLAVGEDGRIRGMIQFMAADTGRWGGRGVQPQNLPRGDGVYWDERAVQLVKDRDREQLELLYGPAMPVVSAMLRGCFISEEGCDLLCVDYSQIEARVLAWLAGQWDVLEAFRTHGKVYELQAEKIYGIPYEQVEKGSEERQMGKVTVLAAGYQMGGRGFRKQADKYGIAISEERADEVIGIFRTANDRIVQLWYDCEDAAKRAVRYPGEITCVGHLSFQMRGRFLTMLLPSGRRLWYCAAHLAEVTTPWGAQKESICYWGNDSRRGGAWSKMYTYGGKLVENATQAVARELMADAYPRLEEAGYPVLLTVHDEIICEVPEGVGTVAEMETIMCDTPSWAEGCPVAAEGWRGKRYRK